ncbi:SDR family NAD(P)-dependent oxidoreductase [Pseudalkalibacillus sp. A8]|uniref:SDR family NAD(P)-dependent oxidoreductase n=1 Tax=Pseudalkalibacillus sp. A8 TaxID=3382641 RepID=UPI0038B64357
MKNILITGAGTGLGKSLAIQYSAEGCHVYLVGRTLKTLEKVENIIKEAGGNATAIVCDITAHKEVQRTIQSLLKLTKIDVLINNAGTGCFGPLDSYTNEEIDQVIATNVKGTINITRAVVPVFVDHGEGQILNIISTAGLRGKKNESVYVASKFAVRGFTESLIKEFEETAIKVTAVYMGGMDTPFWDETDHIQDRSRLKSPDEVAKLIVEQNSGQAEIFIDR